MNKITVFYSTADKKPKKPTLSEEVTEKPEVVLESSTSTAVTSEMTGQVAGL
jgi:hypothetical protein